jgi:hypothetical protein
VTYTVVSNEWKPPQKLEKTKINQNQFILDCFLIMIAFGNPAIIQKKKSKSKPKSKQWYVALQSKIVKS